MANPRDLIVAAQKAGFKGDDCVTAVAIALAESGGQADAINTKNRNGTTDFGAWQINSVHKDLLAKGNWKDINDNAVMAYSVYKSQGFNAWSTYNPKYGEKYKQYLGPVKKVAALMPSAVSPAPDPVGEIVADKAEEVKDALDPMAGITRALDAFTKQAAKIGGDVGSVVIAVVLLILGIVILLRSQVMNVIPAGKVVKTAIKVLK